MYKAPRGTVDLLPNDQKYWRYVERHAADVCRRFGYQRIDTPAFEAAELFVRGVGEQTDVVQKETYTFPDRGEELLTLRPEGTAPVCRAYLQHGMANLPQPVRLYYFCPIFRYERPQAGRYRQHHQFGIECIGDADPLIDTEVIQVAWTVTLELGLKDLVLVINSIGDANCRPAYHMALRTYYEGHLDRVCDDCRARYKRNPLRLLDCKQEVCQPYIRSAPHSTDHLCAPCREHWDSLQRYLKELRIPYQIDHRLVRGLDYYTRTVFEIQPPEEGGQSTIVGGGRYDGLIQQLGGRPTPGIGFGSGMERLILNLRRQEMPVPEESPRPIVVLPMGEAALAIGLDLAARLRTAGFTALLAGASKSLRSQMRYASALQARFAVVLGDREMAQGAAIVRDMDQGAQQKVPQNDLIAYLQGHDLFQPGFQAPR
ncbi:MAG: histidine--tRNA ligase [Chloroflexi bacterium]|nr:histidine--tRNA ligase [Chloroflexota bacterium]